jgi:acyl-CoA reductase-like NAD-dependent aldehyde dehydrogenase
VEDAVANGATVRAGGNGGATVLDGVTPQMRVFQEEIFGPAVIVVPVADDDEAVAIANDTEHGLTAGILTEDSRRGLGLAQRIRTGIVHVGNQTVDDEPQAPFGGVKSSGYGRFGGRWGIEAFSATRWVTIASEHGHFPF